MFICVNLCPICQNVSHQSVAPLIFLPLPKLVSREQQQAHDDQEDIYHLLEPLPGDAFVHPAAQQDGRDDHGQGIGVKPQHPWRPEAGQPVADQDRPSREQEIPLQSSPETLRGPLPHHPVDHDRRAVGVVGPAQDAGHEPEQVGESLALQAGQLERDQVVEAEADQQEAQDGLHHPLRRRLEQHQAHGNAEQGGEDQPPGRLHVHLAPGAQQDGDGDGRGAQGHQRRGLLHPDHQGQQRHRHQRIPEAEGRAREGGEEEDDEDEQGLGWKV